MISVTHAGVLPPWHLQYSRMDMVRMTLFREADQSPVEVREARVWTFALSFEKHGSLPIQTPWCYHAIVHGGLYPAKTPRPKQSAVAVEYEDGKNTAKWKGALIEYRESMLNEAHSLFLDAAIADLSSTEEEIVASDDYMRSIGVRDPGDRSTMMMERHIAWFDFSQFENMFNRQQNSGDFKKPDNPDHLTKAINEHIRLRAPVGTLATNPQKIVRADQDVLEAHWKFRYPDGSEEKMVCFWTASEFNRMQNHVKIWTDEADDFGLPDFSALDDEATSYEKEQQRQAVQMTRSMFTNGNGTPNKMLEDDNRDVNEMLREYQAKRFKK